VEGPYRDLGAGFARLTGVEGARRGPSRITHVEDALLELARNAREVQELAREFYTRLATMGGHVDAVGSALNSAVNRYNKAVSSLESRVLVSARKLRELRITDDELPAPRQVESAARSVEKEVLVSGDTIVPLSGSRRPTQGDLLSGREASNS